MSLEAPAKVNLFLRVLAREESGFHQIETLFIALEFGDTVTLQPTPSGVLVRGTGLPMGPPEENLVYLAAQEFFARSGSEGGVEVTVHKRTPLMAGLGGGSSDAAATLRGLEELFPGALSKADLLSLGAGLGSDVPFFLDPAPAALAWGRGGRLIPLSALPSAPLVLAIPPVPVPTRDAYESLARARKVEPFSPRPCVHSLESLAHWEGVASMAGNDFEEVIFRDHAVLGEIRRALEGTGPIMSLLSGSGGALFAVYRDEASARARKSSLEARFPETEFILTRTVSAER